MYSFDDINDKLRFKDKIKNGRNQMGLSQDEFAAELGFKTRTSLANWESASGPLPTLEQLVKICRVLKVDPNYMLGETDFTSQNDHTIAQAIRLTDNNVRKLRTSTADSRLIDHLLSSAEWPAVLQRIKQICYNSVLAEVPENCFQPKAWDRIQKAFDRFYLETFPLDMNQERFKEYLHREFRWHQNHLETDELISMIIVECEVSNFYAAYPDFNQKGTAERIDILIDDIAAKCYDHLMGRHIIELAELELSKSLSRIVSSFITAEAEDIKARINAAAKNLSSNH